MRKDKKLNLLIEKLSNKNVDFGVNRDSLGIEKEYLGMYLKYRGFEVLIKY